MNERKKKFNSFRVSPSEENEYVFTEEFDDIIGDFNQFKQVDFIPEKEEEEKDEEKVDEKLEEITDVSEVVISEDTILLKEIESTIEDSIPNQEESNLNIEIDKGANPESGKTRTYSERMKQGFFKKSRVR
ncbi:hypothetical protein [Winogradskyella wichelsiae]|uniref:hypothetical protein n=1 Tax=Winogradskyella wichelsiae TaxID=2697007 RepID=UPI003EF1E24D